MDTAGHRGDQPGLGDRGHYTHANGSSNAFVKALLGVLGAVGLSAATVQARLKNVAQSLLKRLPKMRTPTSSQSQSPSHSTSPASASPTRSSRAK